jgi:hypothetical protein
MVRANGSREWIATLMGVAIALISLSSMEYGGLGLFTVLTVISIVAPLVVILVRRAGPYADVARAVLMSSSTVALGTLTYHGYISWWIGFGAAGAVGLLIYWFTKFAR